MGYFALGEEGLVGEMFEVRHSIMPPVRNTCVNTIFWKGSPMTCYICKRSMHK
jgi:hypothetical protein